MPSGARLQITSHCYGGMASAEHMESMLRLAHEAERRGVAVRLDFGGGEALIGRARAGALARFLADHGTHLLLMNGNDGFSPACLLDAVAADLPVITLGEHALLISRQAGQAVSDAHPELRARLGDVRGAGLNSAVFVFDSLIEPGTRRYLDDLESFCARWKALGGAIEAQPLR